MKKMRKSNQRGKKNYTMYNETLYEVERVMQIKWVKNRQLCWIKWKGYDEKYNSWQPKEHITTFYNYVVPEEKDEDSQYQENLPIQSSNNHQYHTRGKIKTPTKSYAKLFQDEKEEKEEKEEKQEKQEKQDNTHISSEVENHNPLLLTLQKTINSMKQSIEPSFDFQIKQKNDPKQRVWRASKNLVAKILNLNVKDGKQRCGERVGRVQMQDGSISYIPEQILKKRFQDKLIQFYEGQFNNKIQRFN